MIWTRNQLLIAASAVSVLIFSLVGIAAFTGALPSAASGQADKAAPVATALPPAVPAKAAPAPAKHAAAPCATCGVIASVRAVEVKGEGSGIGAVAGGVAGAVVGNQFGHGDGRTVMTVAGAAGGAYAGNEIEKQVKKRTLYEVTVRMNDGRLVTLSQPSAPAFAVGERVRLNGNALERG